jgi:hypothetical protein
MIQVYNKTYQNRFASEVTYYVLIQSYGSKPYVETIHESITDYTHYFSKYTLFLSFHPKNTDKIEVEVLRYAPKVLTQIKNKRKLAILSKFIFYIIVQNNNVPITKAISRVIYHNNGEEIILSPNAFLKSYYRLIPIFSQIIQESKSI